MIHDSVKHLFFYGESGAGKSFALDRAMDALGIVPRGFRTQRAPSEGMNRLYISDAREPFSIGGAAIAAQWEATPPFEVFTGAFDVYGVHTLSDIPFGGIVLMDELGFIERDALRFQARVLEVLRGDCHVIGVIKAGDIPFMRAIRAVEGVQAMEFLRSRREEGFRYAYEWLSRIIRAEKEDISREIIGQ